MFRFEDLEIWRISIEISDKLLELADRLEEENKYRFAEQLRGATLSISNNIAEGSAMSTNKEFNRYLSIARGSIFENANMILIFERRNLVTSDWKDEIFPKLERLSKKISALKKTL